MSSLPACQHSDPGCGCESEVSTFDLSNAVNPDKNCCTVCTGDTTCNMFFQDRAAGFPGRCILDEMTYEQVQCILIRNPRAKYDLLRITDDPILLAMARDSKLLESPQADGERAAKKLNANSIPYYTLFKGNTDGTTR